MNPWTGLAELLLGYMRQNQVAQWLRFIFELLFSGFVSFLFICGSVLIATKLYSLAIGAGMIAAAVSMTALFRRESSKLTKGMLVVLPSQEAAKEISTDLQSIQKEK